MKLLYPACVKLIMSVDYEIGDEKRQLAVNQTILETPPFSSRQNCAYFGVLKRIHTPVPRQIKEAVRELRLPCDRVNVDFWLSEGVIEGTDEWFEAREEMFAEVVSKYEFKGDNESATWIVDDDEISNYYGDDTDTETKSGSSTAEHDGETTDSMAVDGMAVVDMEVDERPTTPKSYED
jgi:hypothetical protein